MTAELEDFGRGARGTLLTMHQQHAAFTPIRESATQIVPGEGPFNARLMFIGEAPGEQEDREGRPFVGPSGGLLGQWLDSIGVSRPHVYVTNLLKYRPPGNRTPTPAERHAARPLLAAEVAMVQPRLVILLGAAPLQTVFPGKKLTAERGQLLEKPQGLRPYLVMNHPAACLRNKRQRDWAFQDIKQAKRFS